MTDQSKINASFSFFDSKGREAARLDAAAGFPMPSMDYLRECGQRLYLIQPLVTEWAAATAYAEAYIAERQRTMGEPK